MKQQKIKLDDAWLNINVQDDEIFNPLKFVFSGDNTNLYFQVNINAARILCLYL